MRRQRIFEIMEDLEDAIAAAAPTGDEVAAMDPIERAKWAKRQSLKNVEEFVALVVEWNFDPDDTGVPAPVSVESAMQLDNDTFEAIQEHYAQATRKASPPLQQPSPDGAPSVEELTLPMEPL
jgi:hypothetical protein